MEVWYSPQGNPEVWEQRPEGYLSPEEWQAAQPPVLPEPASVENALKMKLNEIFLLYRQAFVPIEALYPAAEREGWAVQEAEALAHGRDPEAPTPVLGMLTEMRGRGETVSALAAKVLDNAAQWRTVYASLTGQQQRMHGEVTRLAARATAGEVLAYPVAYILPEGLAG